MLDLDQTLIVVPPRRFEAVSGARLEAVGNVWAAFSPASSETHLLNDECAVILEWMLERGRPASSADVAAMLEGETGVSSVTLRDTVELAWVPLLVAGLVRQVDAPGYAPAP